MEDNCNNRYRLYFLLLYKDSTSYDYNEVMFNLKSYKYYAYIEHKPECDEKKPHTHFLLKLENATTKTALSDKIGLPINYIDRGRNERALARYLTHIDDQDVKNPKILYDKSDVFTSKYYEKQFLKHYDDLELEHEIITNIYNFIDNITKTTNDFKIIMPSLLQYINQNAYDSIYKRYRYEFNQYLTMSI